MAESVEQRIKKLKKQLEAPTTNVSNRKQRNKIRQELKILEKGQKERSKVDIEGLITPPKKPNKNKAVRARLDKAKNGKSGVDPNFKMKFDPDSLKGGIGTYTPEKKKKKPLPPLSPGQFPGGARSAADPIRKQAGPKRKPAIIKIAGEKRAEDKRAKQLATQQNVDRLKKEKAAQNQRAKQLATQQTIAGMADKHIQERQAGRKRPSNIYKDVGGDARVAEEVARTKIKKAPDLIDKALKGFGIKKVAGPKGWEAGKRTYKWGDKTFDVDSTPVEDPEWLESLKKGGKVGKKKKKKQGYKARKDESIAMRVKKKRTKKKLKASRDESYGKWGSKKGKGKINRSSGDKVVASSYD
jgi:hypothetical protein